MLLAILTAGCAVEEAPRTRHSRAAHDRRTGQQADADTDADGDTDADADADTDTDSDADPWAADDNTNAVTVGVDVSHWQGAVDWASVAADGVQFALAKATQSDWYVDSEFADNYAGARAAGLMFGGYVFAIPDESDGASQADFLVENGGDWVADGYTIPGVLDIEYNPNGNTCYDLSRSEMAAWVRDFDDEYIALTGRAPLIYSNQDWWNTCVGASDIPDTAPLWVAYWSTGSPALPTGWEDYVLWQYADDGAVNGIETGVDMDRFSGSQRQLRAFVLGE